MIRNNLLQNDKKTNVNIFLSDKLVFISLVQNLVNFSKGSIRFKGFS